MAVVEKRANLRTLPEERRRFQRVKVNLLGRYMLEDRSEFPCQIINMSPGGLAMIAPVSGHVGERVISYIDHVGRLEGVITRLFQNGFAMTFAATPRKRDKLAAQLTWLANRDILNMPEDRRHGRFVPRNPLTRLALPNGLNIPCRIIDASLSVLRWQLSTARRWARWPCSGRSRDGWYATSRTALPSSSRACRIRISLKTI